MRMIPGFRSAVALGLLAGLPGILICQAAAQSIPDALHRDPGQILARARELMRFDRVNESVIYYRAVAAAEQNYQSDRTYPPFFSAMQVEEAWFDPQSAVERVSTQTTFPGGGPSPARVVVTDAREAFALAEEHMNPLPKTFMQMRNLNPWAVVADWIAAGNARFAGSQNYRDYPRFVLARQAPGGEQRLFLDPKSGFPIKLDLEEKHYLWGQRHIEYVYTNWTLAGGVMVPGSSFRLADGKTEISRTTGGVEVVARNRAPVLALPASAPAADDLPLFLQPIDPKTTQVGPETYLLSNPGYTEAVTRVGDEVFLFDATQGEERAKKDAALIGKLFPGYKKLTLVVSDLAWPHIAGVRYWVAEGATIIAHRAARDFLQSVVDRRWTATPDLLEQRRATAKLKFVAVDDRFQLAGGAISLYAIDGIGSEVALLAYFAPDKVLWASDYIQTADQPTSYASEVWQCAQRHGLHPERTVAEHLPLTPWSRIQELQDQMESKLSPHSP